MSTTENEVPATAPEIDPATAEDVYSLPVLEEVPLFNDDVQKRILRRGTGECPVPGALISCHFVGRIRSTKKVFDSSRQRNEPFTFILGEKQVIRAWDNAIGTMRVGEFAILDCKADYCYGAMGLPPDVPEDADLLFEIELLGWEPNTKTISPGVAKQYLRRGEGWSSPGFGSVCTVKILGRIGGETGEVFLDCIEDPILVPIDVPQLPIGLEIALCSMKKKEKAAFWIEGEMAGDGFEPLRHLVPVPRDAQLYYELELEDLETVKETWEMPIAAKVEEARRLKDAGNDFFRAQQPSRALARYDAVLKMFEFDDDEQIAPEDLPGVHAVKLPALCNSAIVRAKQGKHKEVVKLCEEALEIDPDHVKTLYRLAHAQAALGMLDEAVAALEHAREAPGADPARVTEVDRLLGPLRARLAKLNKKEKNMWSSAFSEFSATDDAAPAAKEPEAAVSEPEAAKAAEPVEATKSADAAKPTEEADISAAP